jgi:hypothetical protein
MFYKISCIFTDSSLKKEYDALNPKCTLKWRNYSFKVPWKHLKGDKIHENPLHEKFLILQSLDEQALKNSVIVKLCDF